MNIPNSQFYVFVVDDRVILFQTFEEALNEACRLARSTEFVDLTPNDFLEVVLFFPKTANKITIKRKLFTYNDKLPLAIPSYQYKTETYCYKNIGI